MLDQCYRIGRLFMTRGWIVGVILIALTIGLGTYGFRTAPAESTIRPGFTDALYKAISLLAIQTGAVPTAGNLSLEIARWLGMAFWASALIAVGVRLFRDTVAGFAVKAFARGHVIIAGLGEHGGRLVDILRARGQTVVVIEPRRDHPAIDQCRRSGAVVLFGERDNPRVLRAANLPRASVLLALFLDEEGCVRTATAAFDVLHAEKATPEQPPVRCVLRVIEPGILDVVRRHRIKSDSSDRIELDILNSHEIAATTMVREAESLSVEGTIRTALILGLGTHHRLGEMVVLRAVKDRLIASNGQIKKDLVIHVYDRQARQWLRSFRSRYPFVDSICTIHAHSCWARKIGASELTRDYDAAFVCIGDEGPATAQAVMLSREVLTRGQPIMVRVRHSGSGYGELVRHPESGWGDNIHAVGLEDPLFDADMATRPELELRAQTIHHDYRAAMRRKIKSMPANKPASTVKRDTVKPRPNVPWSRLEREDKAQNRNLAALYDEYLAFTDDRKTKAYRREFAPFHSLPRQGEALLIDFPFKVIDAIARREHRRFVAERIAEGWTFAEERDDDQLQSPYIRDFEDLTKEQRKYSRRFASGMVRILALADYAIVPDDPKTASIIPI